MNDFFANIWEFELLGIITAQIWTEPLKCTYTCHLNSNLLFFCFLMKLNFDETFDETSLWVNCVLMKLTFDETSFLWLISCLLMKHWFDQTNFWWNVVLINLFLMKGRFDETDHLPKAVLMKVNLIKCLLWNDNLCNVIDSPVYLYLNNFAFGKKL